MHRVLVFIAFVTFALVAVAVAEEPEVYPADGQTAEQQERDQFECHEWATKDTGVDPVALAEANLGKEAPSDEEGAARGAGIGAMRGAAGGDAAAGAARGFGIGRMISVLKAKRRLREQQSAVTKDGDSIHGQLDKYDRAYAACLTGRGYSVK
jgi:hypothetical protein